MLVAAGEVLYAALGGGKNFRTWEDWRRGDQKMQFRDIQSTICEKHEGAWRIAFQASMRDPEHLDVLDVP